MMRKRGRKSAAELSIVTVAVDGYRPEPPADLRDPEVRIWREIVATLPGGWFTRANQPLLTAYCRHVATSDRLAQLAESAANSDEPDNIKRWDKLLGMRERESKTALSLARAIPDSGPKLWDRKPWD
jgi:hypothetical protein